MKLQNFMNTSFHPNFKQFRIENPKKFQGVDSIDCSPSKREKGEFRGTEKFLHKETILIQNAKKETKDYKFPEPLDKIIEVIKRQEKNPYDLVLYAKEHANPEDDKVFLALKDPDGNILGEREVYNAVNINDSDGENPSILSHFYTILNMGEKIAEKYRNK